MTYLDLSATFDIINHSVLLDILQTYYGFQGLVLNWIKSCITDRQFTGYVDEDSLIHGFTLREETLITTTQLLETSLNHINDWIHMSHLKVNDSKTDLIVFEKRSLLDTSPLASIGIGKSEYKNLAHTRITID